MSRWTRLFELAGLNTIPIVGGAMLAYNGAPARALTVFVVLTALSDLGSLLPRRPSARERTRRRDA